MTSFAKAASLARMTTMNVSLPDELKAFVDEQVHGGAYGSTSEFVRDLIRREQDRQQLRHLLLDGARSPVGPEGDDTYFASLRQRARSNA
jgi:antitoxin ParD1/3/4